MKTGFTTSSWFRYIAIIVLLHIIGIGGLIYAATTASSAYWGLGILAYTYGLRHAFDADHIAAIDNTVRKLSEQKQNPGGVGFFFSLGHSSVVFILVLLVVFSVKWIQTSMPAMQEIGGIIGMSVSGFFLLLIGIMNLYILLQLLQAFRKMRSGQIEPEAINHLLESRGLLARLFRPLFRFVNRSWHVYPLGFLFGLGFDTATEIGLLALSASAVHSAYSIPGILSLPVLFAAGMSLMDTADGMVMSKAYQWAFITPARKMYYNILITTVSVAAALTIGFVEITQVLTEGLHWSSPFLMWISRLEFGDLGYAMVALFISAWIISIIIWKKTNTALQ
ncbi:HoxN/HupN/NixA family nickel/cobalt transporter [Paenibacillus sp. NPDC058177]|uniref:HoxN/HupN/NixA family nickel/cobalt transporter n=1 Tax=Paenibacillus sp. NPDC058177 TaxID=3346369 RepID=UPI0036D7F2D6